MIINGSYFVGEIYLSQVGEGSSSVANNNNKLQTFIDKHEPDFLEKGLGYKLNKEFYTKLDVNGEIIDGSDAKWSNLLNGTEYQKGGLTYYWKGLIDTKGSLKTSLIANYIYCKYIDSQVAQNTTLGQVVVKGKNTKQVNVNPSIVGVWREMIEWYSGSDLIGFPQLSYKRGVMFTDYLGSDKSKKVSLYQFMNDHKEDFPDWSFTPIENKNRFGL